MYFDIRMIILLRAYFSSPCHSPRPPETKRWFWNRGDGQLLCNIQDYWLIIYYQWNEPLLVTLNYYSKGKAVKNNGYLLQLRITRTLKKVYKQLKHVPAMQAETSSVLQLNGQYTRSIGKSNKLIYHAGRKLIRRTKNPTSDYPAPIQWLTFPLIHSCSCCPQWTHGWLDGQSGWAFRQPAQFLCSFGWLLWVSDHLHLRTKREKRQSAIVPRAFPMTDSRRSREGLSEDQPDTWQPGSTLLSRSILLLSPASSAAPGHLWNKLSAPASQGPADTQNIHTTLPTTLPFVPINYASSTGACRHTSWLYMELHSLRT